MEQTKEPQKKTEGQANAGLEGADIWGEDNDVSYQPSLPK